MKERPVSGTRGKRPNDMPHTSSVAREPNMVQGVAILKRSVPESII